MKRILVHANCQGVALLQMLAAKKGFEDAFHVLLVKNYDSTPIPDKVVGCCEYLLYQRLGPKWGELSSESLLAKTKPGCKTLCLPNMFFKAHWPLWQSVDDFDFGDVFLERLAAASLPAEEMVRIYLSTPPAAKFNLDALINESLEQERRKEAHTPIKYLDYILANHQRVRLFQTVNHPTKAMMRPVVDGVLDFLGAAPLTDEEAASVPELKDEFQLPVDPVVAERLGVRYISRDTRFRCYNVGLTHAEFIAHYAYCRKNGVADFDGYLRGLKAGEGDQRAA